MYFSITHTVSTNNLLFNVQHLLEIFFKSKATCTVYDIINISGYTFVMCLSTKVLFYYTHCNTVLDIGTSLLQVFSLLHDPK